VILDLWDLLMNHEQEKAKKLRKIARLAAQGITKVVEMFAIL
jgi:hypothetical protein